MTEAMDKQNNLLSDKAFEMAVQEGVRPPGAGRACGKISETTCCRSQPGDDHFVSFGRVPG